MRKVMPILNAALVRAFQLFLLYTAVETMKKAEAIGRSVTEYDGSLGINRTGELIDANPNSVAVVSGYNGGAIAMGLIACTCLFLITWIEINNPNRKV